jgi:hypothetical protein
MRIFSRPAQRYTWGALAAVAVCSLGVCEEKEQSSCSLSTLLSTCSTPVRRDTAASLASAWAQSTRESKSKGEREREGEKERKGERGRTREREREQGRERERTDA